MEFNRDLVRWLLLIALLPIGWPFVKALWRDFNAALREEGGLFGRQPSAREVERILEEKRKQPETLVSEPWVKPGDVRPARLRGRGAPGGPRPKTTGRRGGFR
ncbi:MAG: hypothetical protein JNK02_12990 [Planctomycetes bacterium]|nr:hypothetical protein [Planctomycetota bacterium]